MTEDTVITNEDLTRVTDAAYDAHLRGLPMPSVTGTLPEAELAAEVAKLNPTPEPVTAGADAFKRGAAAPRRYDYVPAPELGEGSRVRIQSLNAGEVSAFEASNLDGAGEGITLNLEGMSIRLCCFGMVHEDGRRIFSPREAEHVRIVGSNDPALVERIAEQMRALTPALNKKKDEGGAEGKLQTRSD